MLHMATSQFSEIRGNADACFGTFSGRGEGEKGSEVWRWHFSSFQDAIILADVCPEVYSRNSRVDPGLHNWLMRLTETVFPGISWQFFEQ